MRKIVSMVEGRIPKWNDHLWEHMGLVGKEVHVRGLTVNAEGYFPADWIDSKDRSLYYRLIRTFNLSVGYVAAFMEEVNISRN